MRFANLGSVRRSGIVAPLRGVYLNRPKTRPEMMISLSEKMIVLSTLCWIFNESGSLCLFDAWSLLGACSADTEGSGQDERRLGNPIAHPV